MPSVDAARKTIISQLLQATGPKPDVQAEIEKYRRNVAIIFTDIKGSTAYFEKYGDAAGLMMVNECTGMQSRIVEYFEGKVIKTIGDAVMARFDDCEKAVLAAVEMQRQIERGNETRQDADKVYIRIGLNYGLGIVKSDDVFGDVVNVASRVESAAAPEQILISDALQQQISGSSKVKTRFLGKFAFKGKGEERDVFEVIWNPKLAAQPAAAHTIIRASSKLGLVPAYKLEHIQPDGSIGDSYKLLNHQLVVRRTKGDLRYTADERLAPEHARFFTEKGQLFVEDISGGKEVYIRLIGTYCLLDGDIVRMGNHTFEFHTRAESLTVAAATGASLVELAGVLNGAAAEFTLISGAAADENVRYPLIDERVTWGRKKGTYIFPEDPFMSRTHAVVYHRGEDVYLEDLGSRNGTYVKVRGKAPLPNGASVMLGSQLFRVGFD